MECSVLHRAWSRGCWVTCNTGFLKLHFVDNSFTDLKRWGTVEPVGTKMLSKKMLAMLAASVLVGHCHSAETPAPGGTSQGGKAQSAPQPFDILDLVRVWPPAVCVKDGKPGCRIPSNIKSWIIHGLWPSNSNRRKPDPKDCQPSWKFSMQEIESLHGELKSEWPDESFTKRPKVAWRHEWEKHGTCATSLHPLRDEFHYFNATLALHRRFDLQKLLKPRDDPFTFDDILKTLKNGLGVIPQITCTHDSQTGKSYMEEVKICLNKELTPVDCGRPQAAALPGMGDALMFQPEGLPLAEGEGRCSPHENIYYQPFH